MRIRVVSLLCTILASMVVALSAMAQSPGTSLDAPNLELIGQIGPENNCEPRDVVVSEGIAYVRNLDGSVGIVDVSVPTNPSVLGAIAIDGPCGDLAISGGRAFLASNRTIELYDVRDPANPTYLGRYEQSVAFSALAVRGIHAFMGIDTWGIQILSVLDWRTPECMGFGFFGSPAYMYGSYAEDIMLDGDLAYVSKYGGLCIFDISNPDAPYQLGYCETDSFASHVALHGNTAYLADDCMGLWILDVGDPSNPYVLDTFETPGLGAYGLDIVGDTAYVTDQAGLHVYDVSDRLTPVELQTVPRGQEGEPRTVDVASECVYVAHPQGGLLIYAPAGWTPEPTLMPTVDPSLTEHVALPMIWTE